ncbi:MAG: LysM peptidoglycan-binding domain-containing protein [Betaproteobacteria bacterium]|nr:MAG: LysM peptidoglycan-binding domain-containing protein [Betaproteobacteria bacterium]
MKKAGVLAIALLAAGCAARAPAPVDERRGAVPPAAQPPLARPVPAPARTPLQREYVVKRGDTLFSIAFEHGVDYLDLARWNQIDDPSKLRVGQSLRVVSPEVQAAAPSGTAAIAVGAARGAGAVESRPLDRPAPPATPAAESGMKTAPRATRLPYSEQNLALLSKGESGAAAAPKAAPPAPQLAAIAPRPEPPKAEPPRPEARDPDAIEFMWPARGRLVAGFSDAGNKGIDIAGRPGDAVVAAAPGRVIYTGSGIRGLGKLIVIRHDNNFQSVYAHNREILVKEGQTVARGQKIAELGATDADAPKLHFEIRKSGKPVDPSRYLPSG